MRQLMTWSRKACSFFVRESPAPPPSAPLPASSAHAAHASVWSDCEDGAASTSVEAQPTALVSSRVMLNVARDGASIMGFKPLAATAQLVHMGGLKRLWAAAGGSRTWSVNLQYLWTWQDRGSIPKKGAIMA
mmetsp:Transcript_13164/g.37597  ORF Transcript_13164/g.37597 Transcript_13164/m.37597 type:complete len:132 (+) Transcript_13164:979-1374(+)